MYQPKLDRVKEALGGAPALATTLDRKAAERAMKAAYAAELQAQMRATEEARLRDKMARMGLSPSHSSAPTPSRGANPSSAARLGHEPEYPAPAGAADYGADVGCRRPAAGLPPLQNPPTPPSPPPPDRDYLYHQPGPPPRALPPLQPSAFQPDPYEDDAPAPAPPALHAPAFRQNAYGGGDRLDIGARPLGLYGAAGGAAQHNQQHALQHPEPFQAVGFGVSPSPSGPVHGPFTMQRRADAQTKKEEYRRALEEQMRAKEQQKQQQKVEQRQEEAKKKAEADELAMRSIMGGGGAPLRDPSGHVVADLGQLQRASSVGPGSPGPVPAPQASPPASFYAGLGSQAPALASAYGDGYGAAPAASFAAKGPAAAGGGSPGYGLGAVGPSPSIATPAAPIGDVEAGYGGLGLGRGGYGGGALGRPGQLGLGDGLGLQGHGVSPGGPGGMGGVQSGSSPAAGVVAAAAQSPIGSGPGPLTMKRRADAQTKKEEYRRALEEQMRAKEQQKQQDKLEQRQEEAKKKAEADELAMRSIMGGGGAPLRDPSGHVVADLGQLQRASSVGPGSPGPVPGLASPSAAQYAAAGVLLPRPSANGLAGGYGAGYAGAAAGAGGLGVGLSPAQQQPLSGVGYGLGLGVAGNGYGAAALAPSYQAASPAPAVSAMTPAAMGYGIGGGYNGGLYGAGLSPAAPAPAVASASPAAGGGIWGAGRLGAGGYANVGAAGGGGGGGGTKEQPNLRFRSDNAYLTPSELDEKRRKAAELKAALEAQMAEKQVRKQVNRRW